MTKGVITYFSTFKLVNRHDYTVTGNQNVVFIIMQILFAVRTTKNIVGRGVMVRVWCLAGSNPA